MRIWEIETGRCLKVWDVGEVVEHVAWNPLPELPILAVSVGQDVLVLNTGVGNAEEQSRIKESLRVDESPLMDTVGNSISIVSWVQHEKHDGIRLKHLKKVVHVYDLLTQKLVKRLDTGLHEVSSIAIHHGGDNVIVGSKEGKLCWFDTDLSSKQYKTLVVHPKDIKNDYNAPGINILNSDCNFSLPYLLGWHTFASTIRLEDSGRATSNTTSRSGADLEWGR